MIDKFSTRNKITWCPGCPNFMILSAVKKTLSELGLSPEKVVTVAGIGCHGKIFDYLNTSGIYGLHGRGLPTAMGIKFANPELTVLSFAGDGDTYSEGMAHFIHAGRYNSDLTFIVHDNQSFSLTTGQSTPTSQQNFKSKEQPLGELNHPLNPIKLALASGVSFIARCNARDIPHTVQILKEAIKHKGFSFVEIIQDCIIFNLEANNKDEFMYKINNNKPDMKKAMEFAEEWDYNSKKGKIPMGIFYQEKKPTLEEKWKKVKK